MRFPHAQHREGRVPQELPGVSTGMIITFVGAIARFRLGFGLSGEWGGEIRKSLSSHFFGETAEPSPVAAGAAYAGAAVRAPT